MAGGALSPEFPLSKGVTEQKKLTQGISGNRMWVFQFPKRPVSEILHSGSKPPNTLKRKKILHLKKIVA